jgi:hypothetical protein
LTVEMPSAAVAEHPKGMSGCRSYTTGPFFLSCVKGNLR